MRYSVLRFLKMSVNGRQETVTVETEFETMRQAHDFCFYLQSRGENYTFKIMEDLEV